MPFSGRPVSPRDFRLIEESLRGVPVLDPDLGDAPALPEELIPALVHAVHASRSAIILTDADLVGGPHILYANPACERLTGYSASDVLGLTPRMFQGPSTDRAALDHLRANLEQGLGYEGDVVNYRKDGTPYVVTLRITPVRTGGRTTAFVAIEDDVTRTWLLRTQREANLQALDDALQPVPSVDAPDIELATITQPVDTSDIGGDWSDVIHDCRGRVHLVVGDTSGHGIVAGIYVGRFRWPLCALLRVGVEPDHALAELRRMNAELSAMASIGLVTIDADRRRASVITAGHPDVVVAGPAGVVRLRSEHALIGVERVAEDAVATAVSCALAPGSVVCVYSDGLVERRDESLDVGIDALVEALRATPPGAPLAEVAAHVVRATTGADDPRDDVDVLLARV